MNGTAYSGPVSVAGPSGEALAFSGVGAPNNDYIDLGAPAVLNNSASNHLTVAGWVNINALQSYNYIFSNDRDCCGAYLGYSLRIQNQNVDLKIWDSTNVQRNVYSAPIITTGNWFYVVGTYDGAKMTAYVNGVASGAQTNFAGLVGKPSSFNATLGALASHKTSLGLNGMLDDTRIYDRALSAPEISELYRMNTSSVVNTSGFLTGTP